MRLLARAVIGSAVFVGALVQAMASKLGREVDPHVLALRTLGGEPLSPHTRVGAVCRDGGIYTLGTVRTWSSPAEPR